MFPEGSVCEFFGLEIEGSIRVSSGTPMRIIPFGEEGIPKVPLRVTHVKSHMPICTVGVRLVTGHLFRVPYANCFVLRWRRP